MFDGGLIASVAISRSWQTFGGAHLLFLERRADNRWAVSARLRHRRITVKGFAPTLELAFERQGSNIPLYAYENSRLSIGLSREF